MAGREEVREGLSVMGTPGTTWSHGRGLGTRRVGSNKEVSGQRQASGVQGNDLKVSGPVTEIKYAKGGGAGAPSEP